MFRARHVTLFPGHFFSVFPHTETGVVGFLFDFNSEVLYNQY